MLRHDLQPGKLVAGVILTGTAVAFGGDARGLWTVPWALMVPLLVGGLCLAGVVGMVGYVVQYRRRRGRKSGTGTHGSALPGAGGGSAGPDPAPDSAELP